MSDTADMFKKLASYRQKSTPAKEETKSESETQPVSPSQSPKETKSETKSEKPSAQTTPEEKPAAEITSSEPKRTYQAGEVSSPVLSSKKRGRPATGKRSDPDWIGRTYYIRKETDFDVEDELVKLKRAGINLDKSELVDFLLAAWVKWRKGENIDTHISEISPRRKDELP